MDIEKAVESLAFLEPEESPTFLTFPYVSEIGAAIEELSVSVPVRSHTVTDADKKALVEAVKVQGALGEWALQSDGSVRLRAVPV